MSILLFMDGVVRTETGVPIFEGLTVYHALNKLGPVFLACKDEKEAERWCREHKMTDVDGYYGDDRFAKFDDKAWAKIQYLQAQGQVYLVITADLTLAKRCLENGVKCLVSLYPKYLSPKFRPDGREGQKAWGDIVGELDKQLELLHGDDRV